MGMGIGAGESGHKTGDLKPVFGGSGCKVIRIQGPLGLRGRRP